MSVALSTQTLVHTIGPDNKYSNFLFRPFVNESSITQSNISTIEYNFVGECKFHAVWHSPVQEKWR